MYRLKRLRVRYLLGYLLLGLLLPLVFGIANAQTDSATTETPTQEVIENYKSEIKVRQDGRLKVTETITVFNTEGGDIKRGIYRSFPNPDFKVTSVKRDDDRATYRTEVNGGQKRINIWKKDVYLDPVWSWFILLVGIGFCSWLFWKEPKVYPFPQKVTPRSEPPSGISPTFMSYLLRWENTPNLVIPLISLATKGRIQIREEKGFLGFGKEYKISLKSNPKSNSSELNQEEVTILNTLNPFLKQGYEIKIKSNSRLIKVTYKEIKKSLESKSKRWDYFPKKGRAISIVWLYHF